ncbi:hypothetical protein K7432_014086 [Basidiobolus ranarum]|uniref:Uncharacterized protein n=1 Tax=Basidiobolus ranarum TaxID=34480 RepID=A0ABR2VPX5_9FUNG
MKVTLIASLLFLATVASLPTYNVGSSGGGHSVEDYDRGYPDGKETDYQYAGSDGGIAKSHQVDDYEIHDDSGGGGEPDIYYISGEGGNKDNYEGDYHGSGSGSGSNISYESDGHGSGSADGEGNYDSEEYYKNGSNGGAAGESYSSSMYDSGIAGVHGEEGSDDDYDSAFSG